MKKAKWIWCNDSIEENQYGEFSTSFIYRINEKYVLNIASSSYYVVFINDRVVDFSHCSDFPNIKYIDQIDLTKHLVAGNNILKIQVWHEGLDTQRAFKENPGVIFEIISNDDVVIYSSENTKSRIVNNYNQSYKKIITPQLGFSFYYDNRNSLNEYSNSIEVNKDCSYRIRPIKQLVLKDRYPIDVKKVDGGYLIDLQEEKAGFLELDFISKNEEEILIAYGEHLIDKTVRQKIGKRDFSVVFYSKKGLNSYTNYFRRLAGRYIFVHSKEELVINFIGIRDVLYPVVVNDFDFNDDLLNSIYRISIRTLQLCMHEHYEDCPWREQCLYTMDSTNQIRCGYYCFKDGNSEYVKYNLSLINDSIREDGLLCICAPSGLDYPIPSFALAYLIECAEYIDFSNDLDFINTIKPTILKIVNTFINRIDESGLIPNFGSPYWDFLEWEKYSAGDNENKYSSILNCLFIYALSKIEKYISFDFDVDSLKTNIKNIFVRNDICYLDESQKHASQLSCAMAILVGVGSANMAENIILNKKLLPATLSMKSFVFDSLLLTNNKYSNYIINDILINYKAMIDDGATSFYETIKGAADFDGAGSLCHGWSAIPIVYFNKLLK